MPSVAFWTLVLVGLSALFTLGLFLVALATFCMTFFQRRRE